MHSVRFQTGIFAYQPQGGDLKRKSDVYENPRDLKIPRTDSFDRVLQQPVELEARVPAYQCVVIQGAGGENTEINSSSVEPMQGISQKTARTGLAIFGRSVEYNSDYLGGGNMIDSSDPSMWEYRDPFQ